MGLGKGMGVGGLAVRCQCDQIRRNFAKSIE